jgi:ABC-type nitrate/sulfonate/bicarbonate transport system substrate-binding protein
MSTLKVRFLAMAVTAGLAATACSSAATPAPTAAPTQAPASAATSAAPASAGPKTPVALPAPEVTTITIANSAPTEILGFAPKLALVNGYFSKLGITASVLGMEGAGPATSALAAGQAQLAYVGISIMNTIGSDAPAIMIASGSLQLDDGLFCKASIKSGSDLKGATIGISTFGGSGHGSVLLALKNLNVAAKDVTIKQVGGQGARIAALKGGSIDCANVQDTQGTAALPGFNMVIDLRKVTAHLPTVGLAVTTAFLAKNPNTVLNVMAAVLQGENSMWQDPATTTTAFAADQQMKEADVLPLVVAYTGIAPRSMAMVDGDWDTAIDLYKFNKPDAATPKYSDVYTMSVLNKLRDLGWYAQIGNPQLP